MMKHYEIILICAIIAFAGCGKSDKSLSARAGEKVGEEVTEIVKGIDSGVDKQLAVNVKLSSAVTGSGLTKTVAKSKGLSSDKGFDVYFISSKKLSGTLLAKALNKDNLEIGRAKTVISFNADDAKYISFVFDQKIDTSAVKVYEIDFIK
jgi:hypothetical protein